MHLPARTAVRISNADSRHLGEVALEAIYFFLFAYLSLLL